MIPASRRPRDVPTASRDVGERPLHQDADAHPARPWRGCAARYLPGAGVGGITRFAPPDPWRPIQPPVARRRDRRRADGDAHGVEGAAASAPDLVTPADGHLTECH